MNRSGIHPKGDAVLILLDEVKKKSEGGIALPDEVIDADQLAVKKATVIEIGPLAWVEDYIGERVIPRCAVGDRVYFGAYKGEVVTGKDEKKYRIIRSRDIYATFEE